MHMGVTKAICTICQLTIHILHAIAAQLLTCFSTACEP